MTLVVTDAGCSSTPFAQSIVVDAPVQAVAPQCEATTSSVLVTWPPVAGAAGYAVEEASGLLGSMPADTAWQVTGLAPEQEVVLTITALSSNACPDVSTTFTCAAGPCPDVQITLDAGGPWCADGAAPAFSLSANVSGASGGQGFWEGPGVLDLSGLFDPDVAGPGTHVLTYTWTLDNCSWTATTTVEVTAPPVADAGSDGALTCFEESVTLGGASSTGPGISYRWSWSGGPFPGDSTALHPVVSEPGTYTLRVENTVAGCSSTDQVVVLDRRTLPQVTLTLSEISCFGNADGSIAVTEVTGGQPPYLYALNGGPFSSQSLFTGLGAGTYTIAVQGANGCTDSVTVVLPEPEALDVQIRPLNEDDQIVVFGDSLVLALQCNVPPDSLDQIVWSPPAVLDCDTCAVVTAWPQEETWFTVFVREGGCTDEDSYFVVVERNRPFFVPTAFSPNGDGDNDLFMIFAGPEVVRIRYLGIYSRWGELVFEVKDFPPNDPSYGWDGMLQGRPLNPDVFVWRLEVEFADGRVLPYRGDVTLLR